MSGGLLVSLCCNRFILRHARGYHSHWNAKDNSAKGGTRCGEGGGRGLSGQSDKDEGSGSGSNRLSFDGSAAL